MKRRVLSCLWTTAVLCCMLLAPAAHGQPPRPREAPSGDPHSAFTVIVLGSEGGLAEGSTSAYLVAGAGTSEFACLDAGSLLTGIRAAMVQGAFQEVMVPADARTSLEGYVLRNCIKAYLISHAHLDHIEGLVQASTDDAKKHVIGLSPTLDDLVAHVFNWRIWPNFTNEGRSPLGKYALTRAVPGQRGTIPNTRMAYEALPLSHSRPYASTAFLVFAGEKALLYLGDTGPDAVESSACLTRLWDRIAPLIRQHRLAGIFIECNYPDGRRDSDLYGHLTPSWLLAELRRLAARVDPDKPLEAIRGLPVLVTHVKPALEPGTLPRQAVRQQLEARNDMGLRFLFPIQGQRIEL